MLSYFEQFVNILEKKAVKIYLFFTTVFLAVFSIYLSNVGVFPFKNTADFFVLVLFGIIFAMYRPGWSFLMFIGTILLENVNISSIPLGFELRPYQFFGFLTILSLAIRYFNKKLNFSLIKMTWADWIAIAFVASGVLSSLFSKDISSTFRQSIILASFAALYFLTRTYVQDLPDAKRILPFFVFPGIIIIIYGIWQNIRFARSLPHFEVMPGRPNATFTEADWFGIFIVFFIAVMYSIIYYLNKNLEKKHQENTILSVLPHPEKISFGFSYFFLFLAFIALMITVARSAWLGAAIISIGLLKLFLFDKSLRLKELDWINMVKQTRFILLSFLLAIIVVLTFNLTTFELSGRAQSTALGLQEITVSCGVINPNLPSIISNLEELEGYGCKHIKLEEIETEENTGKFVTKVYRPDPTFTIRADIYEKSWQQIRENPVFGIGWGNISTVLGEDEQGMSLNSSNIFFETWLGAGIIGLISLLAIMAYILIHSIKGVLGSRKSDKTIYIFSLLGLFAIIVPNLFNSGIYLGFFWVYLGVAVSLLDSQRKAQ